MTYPLGMMRNGRARWTLVGMRMFVLLVAFFTIGCGSYDRGLPSEYVFDFKGQPADRAAFVAALDEWNACGSVHGSMLEGRAPDGAVVVPVVVAPDLDTTGLAGLTSLFDGLPEQIEYREGEERVREIFAHELGHAFAGTSVHQPAGLMARSRDMGHPENLVGSSDCARIVR